MSSLEEYRRRDVIRIDVIRPRTNSDKSYAALETSVVGAIVTGATRSQTGGGGAKRTVNFFP